MQRNENKKKAWRHVTATNAICGVKPEHSTLKLHGKPWRICHAVQISAGYKPIPLHRIFWITCHGLIFVSFMFSWGETESTLFCVHCLAYCGAISGMIIGRGNWSTWTKPASVPLCPLQIPHELTGARTRAAAVESRWLTAWAMSRPMLWTNIHWKPV
jgi:hypothetical protein